MGRKSRHTVEQRLQAVFDYESGSKSPGQICKDMIISAYTLREWTTIYNVYGSVGFQHKLQNNTYSKELKENAINDYLNGEGSFLSISRKYKITSKSILQSWVLKYNNHEKLEDYNPKGAVYMIKSRNTTLQEKIEIVNYCKENGNQYKIAAEKFGVPYSQVYKWVKKYNEFGDEGLKDCRGRRKQVEELDELEKLKRDNAWLKRQLELKEMENVLLKKVKEIERRGYSPKGNKNQNT